MNSKVLINFDFKKGAGKSTMTAVFVFLLARMKESILFIDLDPSTTSTQILERTYKFEVEPDKTIYDSFLNNNLEKSIIKVDESLSVIEGDWRLNLWNPVESNHQYLNSMIHQLHKKYKYIIIDVPSEPSILLDNALGIATNIFLILENQRTAYTEFSEGVRYLANSKLKIDNNYHISGIVLSMRRDNPTSKLNQEFIFDAKNKFRSAVLNNPIWYQERIKSIIKNGISSKGIWDMRVLNMYQNILNDELTRVEG